MRLTLGFNMTTLTRDMPVKPTNLDLRTTLRFNSETGEFVAEKDWDQFESCTQCRGRADIEETPDGALVCRVCRAHLPRPST
jgi:hypothetical protein